MHCSRLRSGVSLELVAGGAQIRHFGVGSCADALEHLLKIEFFYKLVVINLDDGYFGAEQWCSHLDNAVVFALDGFLAPFDDFVEAVEFACRRFDFATGNSHVEHLEEVRDVYFGLFEGFGVILAVGHLAILRLLLHHPCLFKDGHEGLDFGERRLLEREEPDIVLGAKFNDFA